MEQSDIQEALIDLLIKVPAFQQKANRDSLLFRLEGLEGIIPRSDIAVTDLMTIVNYVGSAGQFTTGIWPLVILLRNARRYCLPNTKWGRELDELLAQYEPSMDQQDISQLPEILIGADERLPITFLEGALRAQKATARLLVPRLLDAQPIGNPAEAVTGTGWVIGPNMILTNHHVIAARFPGEAPASSSDIHAQASRMIAWFGYNSLEGAHTDYRCIELVQMSVRLDYALLRMAELSIHGDIAFSEWGCLSMVESQPVFEKGARLNIIQHPRGEEKRLAIRSNYYMGNVSSPDQPARIQYLTDTEPGASGSPIFNDDWEVIGLHHAAVKVPESQYRGALVKYNNQGIEITAILNDLGSGIRTQLGIRERQS